MVQTQGEERVPKRTNIALYPHWQLIFEKYDLDSDGRISLTELKNMINSESYPDDIPKHVVRQILKKADEDASGYIEFPEFLKMTEKEEIRSLFHNSLNRYIKATVVQRRRYRTDDEFDGAGDYEKEYSSQYGESSINGPSSRLFIYNPFKRYEAWRYFTYMFVHVGAFHLIVNLLVQIMLGIPLEMVHGWWRVLLIYLAGVVAGSLGTSISDPAVYLAGASGGVYALITAHLATICMNWAEMQFALMQLMVFLVLTIVDVSTAVYTRYVVGAETHIGYTAHLAGALAGLLVGINVLRNLEVRRWEKVIEHSDRMESFVLISNAFSSSALIFLRKNQISGTLISTFLHTVLAPVWNVFRFSQQSKHWASVHKCNYSAK
ncbi:hypothetical protein C0J52_03213 [Blattella germanica]|nr:hypothetical protein C0J52_03213 [Blattella germanica]